MISPLGKSKPASVPQPVEALTWCDKCWSQFVCSGFLITSQKANISQEQDRDIDGIAKHGQGWVAVWQPIGPPLCPKCLDADAE